MQANQYTTVLQRSPQVIPEECSDPSLKDPLYHVDVKMFMYANPIPRFSSHSPLITAL